MPGSPCNDATVMNMIGPTAAIAATIPLLLASTSADAGQPNGQLAILVDGSDPASDAELLRVIDSQLSDMDLAVVPIRVEELPDSVSSFEDPDTRTDPGGVTAMAWIALTGEDRAILFMTDAEGERFLARKLDFGDPAAARETAALVIRATCEALLAGVEISMALPQQPPPQLRPAAARSDEPRKVEDGIPTRLAPILSMSTGYRFQVRSDRETEHGLDVSLGVHPLRWLEIRAGYTFATPVEATRRGGAAITVERHPTSLCAIALWAGDRLSLGGSVSLVADVAVQRTLSIGGNGGFSRSNRDLIWSAQPALLFGFRLVQRLCLFIASGVQIPFNPVRYVYQEQDEIQVIERAWKVQPFVSIGLRADLVTKLRPR